MTPSELDRFAAALDDARSILPGLADATRGAYMALAGDPDPAGLDRALELLAAPSVAFDESE